jgi:hypothetical protein
MDSFAWSKESYVGYVRFRAPFNLLTYYDFFLPRREFDSLTPQIEDGVDGTSPANRYQWRLRLPGFPVQYTSLRIVPTITQKSYTTLECSVWVAAGRSWGNVVLAFKPNLSIEKTKL